MQGEFAVFILVTVWTGSTLVVETGSVVKGPIILRNFLRNIGVEMKLTSEVPQSSSYL